MSMTTQQSPHAILFACPLQGHLNPAVHLAIKLASRGFTVTFVNSESTHHQTSKAHSLCGGEDVFATVRGCGLDIRYATVSDGLPVEHDRFSNHDQFMAAIGAGGKGREAFGAAADLLGCRQLLCLAIRHSQEIWLDLRVVLARICFKIWSLL